MGKVHIVFITYTKNIRIPKHEKHLRLLSSGTKPFITFEFIGSSTEGERYTFFLFWLFILSPHITGGARSAQIHLASASPQSRPFPFGVKFLTNWLSSKPPKSSARASGAWRHSHPQVLSRIFILTSVNDTSSLTARKHLCSSLYLTNPCAEPKGSQPN